jgi:hypothetical protein
MKNAKHFINAAIKRHSLEGNIPIKKLRKLIREIEDSTGIQLLGTEAALFFNQREKLIRAGY